MQAFEYASPKTLKEALTLLGKNWADAAVLAGGTDLISCMKDEIMTPRRVVNVKAITELGGMQVSPQYLRIGAAVSVDDLLNNAAVRTEYPALYHAALGITSPQIRNMGTVGGDLCQRPRCWFFRSGFGLLAMKDGKSVVPDGENKYHAIFGGGPAYFVSASSFGPALAALGARVKLVSPTGSRELGIEKFFVAPANEESREIALQPNEILTEILVPRAAGAKNATYEVRQKDALDWPLATASVALKMKGTVVESARIVIGHVAPTPWDATGAAKSLAGQAINEASAAQAGEAAVAGATPLSGNGYKVQIAKTAVKRALLQAVQAKT